MCCLSLDAVALPCPQGPRNIITLVSIPVCTLQWPGSVVFCRRFLQNYPLSLYLTRYFTVASDHQSRLDVLDTLAQRILTFSVWSGGVSDGLATRIDLLPFDQ